MNRVQDVICVAFNNSPVKPDGIILVPDGSGKTVAALLAGKYQVLELSEVALSTVVAIMTDAYAQAVKLNFLQHLYNKADYEAALAWLAAQAEQAKS